MQFEEYVQARGPALLRLAFVLTGESHSAQDLVQDALLRTYRRWDRVVAADQPDAYVRRILVNEYGTWRRRRRWGERPSPVADAAARSEDTAAQAADPATEIAARDEMRAALAALAPRARTVVVLRYYGDLTDVAIAELLGVTPSTVRATASKALQTLRRTYDVVPASPAVPVPPVEELR